MIIDFHVHTAYYETTTEAYDDLVRRAWGDRTEWMIQTYSSPEGFLGLMDEAGIDYAVILAELAPITTGIADNAYVGAFCSKSPRLIPFASINPYTSTRPAEELERLVQDEGFRGLKLYPTYQHYYPNDAHIYPLYAKAQELKIPVSLHIGSSIFAGARIKYGDPITMDDVFSCATAADPSGMKRPLPSHDSMKTFTWRYLACHLRGFWTIFQSLNVLHTR
jgi:predicted TIM-barrel fold metal-dependent hydrolase